MDSPTGEFLSWLKVRGLFDEFRRERKTLLDGGVERGEANLQAAQLFGWPDAWRDPEYGVFDAPAPEEDPIDLPRGVEIPQSANAKEDHEWVYRNIYDPDVDRSQAPSQTALFMLDYYRDARREFMEKVARPLLQREDTKRKVEDEQLHFDDGREKIGLVDEIIAWNNARDRMRSYASEVQMGLMRYGKDEMSAVDLAKLAKDVCFKALKLMPRDDKLEVGA